MNPNVNVILERAKELILKPAMAWESIKQEKGDLKQLYLNYAMPLALIPVVCGLIGITLFGVHLPGGQVMRAPFFSALLGSVLEYAFQLLTIFLTAHLIVYFAPYFNIKADLFSAAKLLVYSMTPLWLVGVFQLFPGVAFLSILGLYAGYLLVVGLPVLLEISSGKLFWTALAVIIAWILIGFVLNLITFGLIYGPMYMRMMAQ
ncbi:MAG: Yip1 family protein [Candidatus Margulisbacteria bacterium]|nr:Yip1 family protein [Candidatus Margulisiibacteriota bacterium]